MSDCSVSVVIPVGHVAPMLRTQLDAVGAQKGVDLAEIVLALNDSAPRAVRALWQITGHDPRVRVADATQHAGAAHARNAGAAVATGDVLAFCDADDIAQPGWLATLVAGLDEFDAVGGALDEMPGVSTHQRPPPTPGALPTFLGVPYVVSANLALPRRRFQAAGGFDVSLHRGEDIAFSWGLLVAGCTLGYVDGARIWYRPRTGSIALVRQHFAYGWGMGQVLRRYGIPDHGDWRPVRGRQLLAPNGQPGGSGGLFSMTRRASLAGGRVFGAVTEAVAGDRARTSRRVA